METLVTDAVKSAEAVNLVYVHDNQEGILRVKKRNSFSYVIGNKKITDKDHLERIKKLVIPPAWDNVWICVLENGHLQATGFDLKKRKQYKYHPLWNALRNHTKFYRLHEFGKALPSMRSRLEKDLLLSGLPLRKVLAAIVSLMELTNIRVGNNQYEKLYGSFGLTTLKDRHVKFNGSDIRFAFRGKKGIQHFISITDKRLSNIVKKCRDIPGKELFQYIDENGDHKTIDSGMVNDYIKEISGRDFSTKDFRTWSGSVHALQAFKDMDRNKAKYEIKNRIVQMLTCVSQHLGNTRNVCKKYYVHPVIISLYENNSLEKYLNKVNGRETAQHPAGLTSEERTLMHILEKEPLNIIKT